MDNFKELSLVPEWLVNIQARVWQLEFSKIVNSEEQV